LVPVAAVVAITIFGAALRIVPLDESGLWRDEVSSMVVAGLTAGDIITHSRLNEPHPPLYYLLLHGWLGVFGHSTAAGMALSLIFGVALIPITWLVGRRLFSPEAGVFAALLVACSPELIRYSTFLRPYSILPVLVVAGTYALSGALTRGGLYRWTAYLACVVVTVGIHYWPLLIVASQAVIAGIWLVWNRPRMQPLRKALILGTTLAILCGPLAWKVVFADLITGHPPKPVPVWAPFVALAQVATGLPISLAVAVLLVLLADGARRVYRSLRQQNANVLQAEVLALCLTLGVALVSIVLAWLLSFQANMLQVRFLLMPAPLVLLALAWALARLRRRRPVVAIIALEALVAANLLGWHFDRFVHSNGRELAASVQAHALPSDLIVFAPSWVGASFTYYYRGPNQQLGFPLIRPEGLGSLGDVARGMAAPNAVSDAVAVLARAKNQGRRVWLVMERRSITDTVTAIDPGEPQTDETYSRTAIGRTNELRRELARLYGPPDTTTVPPDRRPVGELLTALLYAPDTPDPRR
jgi:4-amino-4-deoxy-L-arabinose transferase-like glycosyltransferase